VFTGLGGDPLAPDRLTRHFRALAKAAGLPPVRLHDLRHGAATLALAAGVELKVVQDMMGHASIVLTADTYTSVLPEVARTAAEQVASLILKAGRLIPGTTRARRSPGRRKRKPRSAAPARLTLAHPARQITRPPAPGHQPSLNPLAKARLRDGRQASTESPSTRKGHLNTGQPAGQLTPGRTVGHAHRAPGEQWETDLETASRRTGILGTQSGHSAAPHKIDIEARHRYNTRSGRVRRQGLEPRTRGLRALLWYQISALDTSWCRPVRTSARIPAV